MMSLLEIQPSLKYQAKYVKIILMDIFLAQDPRSYHFCFLKMKPLIADQRQTSPSCFLLWQRANAWNISSQPLHGGKLIYINLKLIHYTNFSCLAMSSYGQCHMEKLAGDLWLGLKFVKLEILSTSFMDFLYDKLGELRSRSLAFISNVFNLLFWNLAVLPMWHGISCDWYKCLLAVDILMTD